MYSSFYIDVGIYIYILSVGTHVGCQDLGQQNPGGIRGGIGGIPGGILPRIVACLRWDPAWTHPKLAGSWVESHPRRSIIPVGIPPGIKTGSRLGSHPGLAGSRVGSHLRRSIIPVGIPPGIKTGSRLRQDPAWDPTQDWRDPGFHNPGP